MISQYFYYRKVLAKHIKLIVYADENLRLGVYLETALTCGEKSD